MSFQYIIDRKGFQDSDLLRLNLDRADKRDRNWKHEENKHR